MNESKLTCHSCRQTGLQPILSLGRTLLADKSLAEEQLAQPELTKTRISLFVVGVFLLFSLGFDYFMYLQIVHAQADPSQMLPLQSADILLQSANIPFNHVIIDSNGPQDPHTKFVGDINGDGFIDVLAASSANGPLVWYEYPNWTKHVIATSGRWSTDAEVGDVDGDGDQDVIISDWYLNNRIEWYENPGPTGDLATDPWTLHVIGGPRAHDIEIGDLDGDGDIDIVTRQQGNAGNQIEIWMQNAPTSWAHRSINCPSGEGLHLGDIDKDGDPDVIIGGRWYENPGGVPNGTWTEYVFASNYNHAATYPWMADINKDGRPDVVLTPTESKDGTHRTSWYEAPPDPRSSGWTEHVIDSSVETVTHSLGLADMDNDGDLDVVTAEMHQSTDPDEVRVYINEDGDGVTWMKQVVAKTGSHNARVADIGNDGDFDIVGANWSGSYQPVEMWENLRCPPNTLRIWLPVTLSEFHEYQYLYLWHNDAPVLTPPICLPVRPKEF